jgi:Dehydrogenases with different specificities (related to short-chain alcohol dehydrogenases)
VIIDLSGKTAIVSASTAGIGLAIATGIAAAGAHTLINGRKQDAVDRAIDVILKTVPAAKLRGFAGDLSTPEGCDALAKILPQTDILVNNLGVYGPGDVFTTTDEDWERYFQVNVMSGVRLNAYLSQGHDGTQMGARRVHLVGVGTEHSPRYARVRILEDRTTEHRARHRQAGRRHWRDGECRAAGAHFV